MKRLSWFIILCLAFAPLMGTVQAESLFPSGDFEDGTDSVGLMNCTLAPAYDSERGNVAKMSAVPQQLVHLDLGMVSLEPNTDYMISVWIKAVSGIEINPRVIFVNGNEQALYKWVYFSDPTYPSDPTDGLWRRVTCIYNSGESFLNDNTILFRVGSETATNNVDPLEIYLDDLYFGTPLPMATARMEGTFAVNGTVLASHEYDNTYNKLSEGDSRYRLLMADALDGEWTEVDSGTAKAGAATEYTFTEEDIGKYIKYEIIPVDTDGNEGAAAFTAPKRVEDYFTVEAAVDEPVAGERVSGSITLSNYGETLLPAAVMVLRDDGNVLSDVYTLRQEVGQGVVQVFPTRLTMPESIEGYTLEQYLWYDFTRFSPLVSKDFTMIYPPHRYPEQPQITTSAVCCLIPSL